MTISETDGTLDSRDWSDQRKLDHSMAMAEKLIDRRPEIAAVWLNAADIIRKRMASVGII